MLRILLNVLQLGISSSGEAGEAGTGSGAELVTNAVANTEDSVTHAQVVADIAIWNDGTSDIWFGFDVSTATRKLILKPGESIFMREMHKVLYYISTGVSVPFRIWLSW